MVTRQEAIQILLIEVFNQRGDEQPENEVVLFDCVTHQTDAYWAFTYNNRKYIETRDAQYAWIGTGYLLVRKHDGCVQQLGNQPYAIYDYLCEQEAGDKRWCLIIDMGGNLRHSILLRLKQALGLSQHELADMRFNIPGPLFTGERRHLDWVAKQLLDHAIPCHVTLCEQHDAVHLPILDSYTQQYDSLTDAYRAAVVVHK